MSVLRPEADRGGRRGPEILLGEYGVHCVGIRKLGLAETPKKGENIVSNEKVLSYLSTHLKQSQQQEQVSVVPSAQEKPPIYCTLCHTDAAANHNPDRKAELLCKAVRYGCKSCARTLLAKGSDPLRPCSRNGSWEETALEIATEKFVEAHTIFNMLRML